MERKNLPVLRVRKLKDLIKDLPDSATIAICIDSANGPMFKYLTEGSGVDGEGIYFTLKED